MTRERFSDYVLRDWHRSHLEQTAEEIAEALQIPLHKLLERARRAGIVLSRDPGWRHEGWPNEHPITFQSETDFAIGRHIRKATSSDRCGVMSMGFWNPFER